MFPKQTIKKSFSIKKLENSFEKISKLTQQWLGAKVHSALL